MVRSARLFLSPFPSCHSRRLSRQVMHQQPPQAPRVPNSFSRSGQRSGVKGKKSSLEVLAMNLAPRLLAVFRLLLIAARRLGQLPQAFLEVSEPQRRLFRPFALG